MTPRLDRLSVIMNEKAAKAIHNTAEMARKGYKNAKAVIPRQSKAFAGKAVRTGGQALKELLEKFKDIPIKP